MEAMKKGFVPSRPVMYIVRVILSLISNQMRLFDS